MQRLLALLSFACLLSTALPGAADPPPLVVVREAGNPADSASGCYDPVGSGSCGAVPYVYQIGRYEVTNQEYAEFLNAVADSDPNNLYNPSMASDARGGITRSGSSGSYSYAVKAGRQSHPVVFVSFYDALRYANWLHNGQPNGAQGNATTEGGAYTITSGGVSANSIARNAGARWFLPSENEWYKAAYYDFGVETWFEYPQRNYTFPTSEAPPGGATSANYWAGTYALTGSASFDNGFNYLSQVGAYTSAASDAGTFDQGGNAMEWTEGKGTTAGTRVRRGSSWYQGNALMSASVPVQASPTEEAYDFGFRVAAPEPAAALLGATALLAIASLRRSRPAGRRTW
jgi:formylglycine-generating enzyme required for sulfatase activity